MAETTDTTIKTYYEHGDVPTESNFIDFIDSKVNKQDLASTDSGKGADLVAHVMKVFDVADFGADNTGATDALAAFNAAISASSAGDTIYAPDGTYVLSGSFTVVDRTLQLAPGATISYAVTTSEATTNYPLIMLGDGGRLVGGNIAGAGADYTYSGELGYRTAGDANVSDHTLVRVYGDDCEVSGVTLSEVEAYGIAAQGAARGVISKNHIYNTTRMAKDTRGRYGIALLSTSLGGSNNEKIRIVDNVINNMSVGVCVVGDSLTNGVTVWTDSSYNTITSNIITNSSEHGMYLAAGSHSTITGNSVVGASQNGIKVHQRFTSITGNTIRNVEGGITVQSPGGDCTIANNSIRVYTNGTDHDTARGILLNADDLAVHSTVTGITNVSGTTYLVTTSGSHGYSASDTVRILGTTNFNGPQTVTSVPLATTFQFTHSNSTDSNETGLTAYVGDSGDSRFERGISPDLAEFYVGGNTVTGNRVFCTDDSVTTNIGLYVISTAGGQTYFRDNKFSGNIIEGFSTGARILRTTGTSLVGNSFRGGSSGSAYTQLTARTVTGITNVSGTTYLVTTSGSHGAKITSTVAITGTTNFNGTIEVTSVPSSTTFQFTHANSTDADETGLTASGTVRSLGFGAGISLQEDNDSISVVGNTVRGFAVDGIIVWGTVGDFATIGGNSVYGNTFYGINTLPITAGATALSVSGNLSLSNTNGALAPTYGTRYGNNFLLFDGNNMWTSRTLASADPPTSTPVNRGDITTNGTKAWVALAPGGAWAQIYP